MSFRFMHQSPLLEQGSVTPTTVCTLHTVLLLTAARRNSIGRLTDHSGHNSRGGIATGTKLSDWCCDRVHGHCSAVQVWSRVMTEGIQGQSWVTLQLPCSRLQCHLLSLSPSPSWQRTGGSQTWVGNGVASSASLHWYCGTGSWTRASHDLTGFTLLPAACVHSDRWGITLHLSGRAEIWRPSMLLSLAAAADMALQRLIVHTMWKVFGAPDQNVGKIPCHIHATRSLLGKVITFPDGTVFSNGPVCAKELPL